MLFLCKRNKMKRKREREHIQSTLLSSAKDEIRAASSLNRTLFGLSRRERRTNYLSVNTILLCHKIKVWHFIIVWFPVYWRQKSLFVCFCLFFYSFLSIESHVYECLPRRIFSFCFTLKLVLETWMALFVPIFFIARSRLSLPFGVNENDTILGCVRAPFSTLCHHFLAEI